MRIEYFADGAWGQNGLRQLHSFEDAVKELYAYYQAHKEEIPYDELKGTH